MGTPPPLNSPQSDSSGTHQGPDIRIESPFSATNNENSRGSSECISDETATVSDLDVTNAWAKTKLLATQFMEQISAATDEHKQPEEKGDECSNSDDGELVIDESLLL